MQIHLIYGYWWKKFSILAARIWQCTQQTRKINVDVKVGDGNTYSKPVLSFLKILTISKHITFVEFSLQNYSRALPKLFNENNHKCGRLFLINICFRRKHVHTEILLKYYYLQHGKVSHLHKPRQMMYSQLGVFSYLSKERKCTEKVASV